MKAVLSKNKKGGYILSDISSGWCIGSTDHEYVLNHKGEQTVYKLSKQNCDEIFLELYDTEIEVEIEMETTSEDLDEMAQPQYAKVPKLDENRCLILKNKYNMKPAVEWLVQQLRNGKEFNDELIQQAKEMEKEQELKIKIQCLKESLQFIDANYMVELLNVRIYNMEKELLTFKSE